MISVTCTSCERPLSLDETKIPAREISFPCPACKAQVTVDGRKLAPNTAGTVVPGPQLAEPAVMVGVDDPLVREAARSLGFQPQYLPTPEAARDFIMHEFPPLVFLRPAQMTPPPLAEMGALIALNPADRRKVFMILVAENIRTFDGNAAFLYGVNLVVASKDLASMPQIYRDAEKYHRRLYQTMFSLQEQR